MICTGVGTGLTVNPETGEIGVVLSMHEVEDQADPSALINMPPDKAAEIAMALMARATEGSQLIAEVAATPPDDREAKLRAIIDRLYRPLN